MGCPRGLAWRAAQSMAPTSVVCKFALVPEQPPGLMGPAAVRAAVPHRGHGVGGEILWCTVWSTGGVPAHVVCRPSRPGLPGHTVSAVHSLAGRWAGSIMHHGDWAKLAPLSKRAEVGWVMLPTMERFASRPVAIVAARTPYVMKEVLALISYAGPRLRANVGKQSGLQARATAQGISRGGSIPQADMSGTVRAVTRKDDDRS
ncbi:hypothetical protein NDU88_004393 [Pleurodeles waltl]|uniref:Uncharacterized protein n=1 Tax=Pleurodeles waltl TaxID=8319 RepID=A0AAV7UFK3_PLEWA|nr:hypothetical protein NDU88_004393 [Pleurodeles waltl]